MENEKRDKVQEALTQVARHGFAVYSDEIMIAWVMSPVSARKISGATHIVNVQNGVSRGI